jgi:hypothetical protein
MQKKENRKKRKMRERREGRNEEERNEVQTHGRKKEEEAQTHRDRRLGLTNRGWNWWPA